MKTTNIGEIIIKLDKLEDIDIQAALAEACRLVETDAKLLCPVDTGQLQGSITHEVAGNQGKVYSNVEYAPYVELGTGLFAANGDGRKEVPWHYQDAEGNWHTTYGQHPQPFMHPALANNVGNIKRVFEKHIRKAVNNG